jgi:hypothetical protein
MTDKVNEDAIIVSDVVASRFVCIHAAWAYVSANDQRSTGA